jgi:hypothetical protein
VNRIRWSENEIGVLRSIYSEKNNEEIAKILGRNPKSIMENANKLGLYKLNRPIQKTWTDQDQKLLSDLYPTTPPKELEKIFGRSISQIRLKASRLNFVRDRECTIGEIRTALTKKIINQDYFETVNTEGKAYFLGLLWADGGLSNKNNRSQTLLKLIEQDSYILDAFQTELKSTYKLIYRIEKLGQSTFTLTISSKKIFDDLAKYNIVPNKTYLNLSPPSLSPPLIRHFFRGVFDGDGCISGKIGNFNASIVGSSKTCEWACETTRSNIGIGGGSYRRTDITYVWQVNGKHQLSKLAEWLYKDASFFLSRKHNKFVEGGLI